MKASHLAILAAALMTGTATAQAPARKPARPIFEVDRNWPKQMPNGYVFGPSGGVTVDAAGNVWVYTRPQGLRLTVNNPPDPSTDRPRLRWWSSVLTGATCRAGAASWP